MSGDMSTQSLSKRCTRSHCDVWKIDDELNSKFLPTFIVLDVLRRCLDGTSDVTPSDDECPASRICNMKTWMIPSWCK